MFKLEIACNNYGSCLNALAAGADRIELFENLPDGGCTPSAGMIRKTIELTIPMYVMIRPRGGNFVYNTHEKDIMLNDLDFCKSLAVKGIVFGCLLENGSVDKDFCAEMMNLWKGPATFHRAIDRSVDMMAACKTVIDLGFERILSSGGAADVMLGLDTLKKMNAEFSKDIVIMPGAGVKPENALEILNYTCCREIHATCKVTRESNEGNYSEGIVDFLSESSKSLIEELRNAIDG